MQNHIINKAISETQQCLARYWQRDYQYVLERLGTKVTWIGALQEEFMTEKERIINDLMETSISNPTCHLLQQEFWSIADDKKTCIIAGRYLVTTDDKSGEIIQEQQRATFVWEEQAGVLKIVHMHISCPMGYLEPGEYFPHKTGKMTYQYLQDTIEKHRGTRKNIEVREVNGHIRFVSIAEIEFAEAMDHNTMITTVNGIITARISWKDFLACIDTDFIKVHRSYVVNLHYIKRMKNFELEMTSGKSVPVPAKRFREVYTKWKEKLA